MPSAWGGSWGTSWGNSWGESGVSPVVTPPSGGGGYVHHWFTQIDKYAEHGQKQRLERYKQYATPRQVRSISHAVQKTIDRRLAEKRIVDAERELNEIKEQLARQAKLDQELIVQYGILIALEYTRLIQEYEDAQIAMMLFDM